MWGESGSKSPPPAADATEMAEYFHTPVTPFTISPSASASQLIAKMAGTSFQARNLAKGAEIWAEMLEGKVTIFFGLSGAMVPAGMRQLLVYLIQNRLIDCLVSTGANLFHDLHETLGRRHWKCEPPMKDIELGQARINRIYDVILSEKELDQSEEFIADFACTLSQDRPYTTREFLYLIGKAMSTIPTAPGILTSAAQAGMPIYSPALGDSVFGTALAAARVRKQNRLQLDIVKDVVEMIRIDTLANSTGVIFIGGGTPKNFIQQAVLCGYLFQKDLPGHSYAIQITTDSPQWGGLSGCTFEEAQSWRKITPTSKTATIYSDATIALPLLVSALAETCAESIAKRKKPIFSLGEDLGVS